jgi:hypothetical protein
MRAMRDGATEIRVSGRPQGLGHIVTIIPELPPREVISPSVPELMQHLETIKGQTILLNLDELIEAFLREAYPSNRLGEEYVTNLRSAPAKEFEIYIESADVKEGEAVIRLKSVT